MEATTKEKSKKLYFSIEHCFCMENFVPKGKKSILIRVLEPEYKKGGIPYKIKNIDKFSNVLELYFHDVYGRKNPEDITELEGEYEIFTKEMALELNNFILNNDFDEVVIHCAAGMSRSPAIAMCVARILKLEELAKKIAITGNFTPNLLVLSVFSKIDVIKKDGFKETDVIFDGNLDPVSDEEIKKASTIFVGEDPEEFLIGCRKWHEKRIELYAKIWGFKLKV